MPVTTEQQIAEWEKLSNDATPGPWGRAGTKVTAKSIGYASVCDTETDNDKMCENAAFIAAAREAVPALIADLREAREELTFQREFMCPDDALLHEVETAAGMSFNQHRRSIKGNTVTAADSYESHLVWAATARAEKIAQAKLDEAEKEVDRWKERAEFEYSKHMYPDTPGLAVGALDAHMRAGWTWIGKQEAIDAALTAQEKP